MSSGDCPFNSVECLTSHRPLTKTYKRRFLANPTECSPEELLGSASELLFLTLSWTCSEPSFTRTSAMGEETFVPDSRAPFTVPASYLARAGNPGLDPLTRYTGHDTRGLGPRRPAACWMCRVVWHRRTEAQCGLNHTCSS